MPEICLLRWLEENVFGNAINYAEQSTHDVTGSMMFSFLLLSLCVRAIDQWEARLEI